MACLVVVMVGCADKGVLPVERVFGPDPELPPPRQRLLPTVNIAPAVGWDVDAAPQPATGLRVSAFARDLEHPRWLYVLPNNDVLVAETNAPVRPQDARGIRGWIVRWIMRRAGAATPSADRITLLRDADGDGLAETRSVLLEDLHSPFGMALVGDYLYVANTGALMRFSYTPGALTIGAPGEKVSDLPAGPLNHHWTKNVLASDDGQRLYISIGSNSNVGENGMEQEVERAAILEIDVADGTRRIFASGLRNPVGLAWRPGSRELWTTVNERDELGDNLVPDYMTAVSRGEFYGWPYSYYGQHVDPRVLPGAPEQVARARVPDFALGAHTASLGLAFYDATLLPERYRGGALIAQHGSWNRRELSGYKVIFVPFSNGRPQTPSEDFLSGFVNRAGQAQGRPTGVVVDTNGAVLVADDVGNVVWRVVPDIR